MALSNAAGKKKTKSPTINIDFVDAMTAFRLACRNGILSNVLLSLQNVLAIVNDDDNNRSITTLNSASFSKKLLNILFLDPDSSNATAFSCAIEGGYDYLVELFLSFLFVSFVDKLDFESIHSSYSFNDWFSQVFGCIHPKLKPGWLKRMGHDSGFDSLKILLVEEKYTVNNIMKILTQYVDETKEHKKLHSLLSIMDNVLMNGYRTMHDIKSTRTKARKPKINLRSDYNRYEAFYEEWDDNNSSFMVEDSSSLSLVVDPMTNHSNVIFVDDVQVVTDGLSELHGNNVVTDGEGDSKSDTTPPSCEVNEEDGDWDIVSCSDMDEFEEVQYSFKDALSRSGKDCVKLDSFILVETPEEASIENNRKVVDPVDSFTHGEYDADFDRDGYKYVSKGRFRANDRLKREYMKKMQKHSKHIV